MRKTNLSTLGKEGVRRAVKFSSRRDLTSPKIISKGQRCTPLVVAAIQAAYLQDITHAKKDKVSYKKYRDLSVDSYGNEVFTDGWRDTPLGKLLLKAAMSDDYSQVFPDYLNFDQRFVLPSMLFSAFLESSQVTRIATIHYFNNKIEQELHIELSTTSRISK